jgi:hypothetical protein
MATTDLNALRLRMDSILALYLTFFAPSRLCVKSFDFRFFNKLLVVVRSVNLAAR